MGSILHVTKGGEKRTYQMNDNKSGSLHRYLDLDTHQISYHMGKQIGGKTINPDGALGRGLIEFATQAFQQPDASRIKTKTPPAATICGLIAAFIMLLLILM